MGGAAPGGARRQLQLSLRWTREPPTSRPVVSGHTQPRKSWRETRGRTVGCLRPSGVGPRSPRPSSAPRGLSWLETVAAPGLGRARAAWPAGTGPSQRVPLRSLTGASSRRPCPQLTGDTQGSGPRQPAPCSGRSRVPPEALVPGTGLGAREARGGSPGPWLLGGGPGHILPSMAWPGPHPVPAEGRVWGQAKGTFLFLHQAGLALCPERFRGFLKPGAGMWGRRTGQRHSRRAGERPGPATPAWASPASTGPRVGMALPGLPSHWTRAQRRRGLNGQS